MFSGYGFRYEWSLLWGVRANRFYRDRDREKRTERLRAEKECKKRF